MSEFDVKNMNMISSMVSKDDIINSIIKTTNYIDDNLTKKISSIVKGPKIEVYVDRNESFCSRKIPNAFTILGFNDKNDMATGIAEEVTSISIPNILKLIFCPIWILYVWNIYKNKKQLYAKYTYNEDGTLTVENVPYIPIFLTEAIMDLCDENELIAVFLHEVGHHDQYIKKMYEEMIPINMYFGTTNIVHFITVILASGNIFDDLKNKYIKHYDDSVVLNDKFKGNFTYYAIIIALSFILGYTYNKIFRIDVEYKSDECAVKCGYGPYLYSAFNKMEKGYRKKDGLLRSFFKICIKFLGFIVGYYNFPSHPSSEDRNNRIMNYEREKGNVVEDENGNETFKINMSKKFINIFEHFINLLS